MLATGFLLYGVTLPLMADTIGMRTAKEAGQSLTLALNPGVQACLDWGNGKTSDLVFTGEPQEIILQSDSLQIITQSPVTALYCAGNELTALNVKQASGLQTIVCHDNRLASLDLTLNRSLTRLNCQRNELAALTVRYCTQLQSLNCAQNPLKTIDMGLSLRSLTSLICADCELTSLSTTYLTKLRQLWCQNNKLNSLDLQKNKELRGICAFGNCLTAIKLNGLGQLQHIYVDDNQLETLDLSAQSLVETISIDHNRLSDVTLTSASKATLKYFYACDNQLAFNSFPEVYTPRGSGRYVLDKHTISPQRPVELVTAISVGDEIDLSAWINMTGFGKVLTPSVIWKAVDGDKELVLNEDYKLIKKGVYSFLKPIGEVYAEATSSSYPDFIFKTTAVWVVNDATPVKQVAEDNLHITAVDGMLVVTATEHCTLKVLTADGRMLLNTVVAEGIHQWNLPSGVYIVNGRKLVVGR